LEGSVWLIGAAIADASQRFGMVISLPFGQAADQKNDGGGHKTFER